MHPQLIELPPLDLRALVGTVNADKRTVDLTFTTGADVVRFDWSTGQRYIERLSLDPKAVRLDRLNAGAPLLDAHSAYSVTNQLGIVEPGSARLTGSAGLATVRFSKRAEVEPYYQDVLDRIIRNVSVGYQVHRFEESQDKTEMPVRLATDWEPFEISMVPMGADRGAQTRDGKSAVQTYPCVLVARGLTQNANRERRFQFARRA